jgi:hypothetical protein
MMTILCRQGLAANRATIVVGESASPVEKHAAQELQKYIRTLFKFSPAVVAPEEGMKFVETTFLLGSPANNSLIAHLAGEFDWKSLSADGFFLKTLRRHPDVVLVGGRSGRGSLFGVYELVEHWGVRFSLSEDIFPDKPGRFQLPPLNEKYEPAFPIRCITSLNNLPEGSAGWGLSDFTHFIDQMTKLKYNTASFMVMASGPWLDYEFRGVKRPAGNIFYGWNYPINDWFVGKELFKGQHEYYSPVLGKARNDEELKQQGIGLVRSIIDYCKQRDLMFALDFYGLLELPTAFKRKFNEWASLPLPDPKIFPNAHPF